ncbi:MAG: glutathione S-transferase family protein [Pseudomonadota bacterium]
MSQPPITLYAIPASRGIRVTATLEELGLDYDFRPMMPGTDLAKELHCMAKTPVLKYGDLSLIESAAICQFLASRHGQGTLLPAEGSDERARHDQLLWFVVTELEQPLWTLGKHSFVMPKEARVEAIKPVARAEFARALAGFERLFGDGPYAMGEQFTLVDILAAHTLNWAVSAKCAVDSPAVSDYRARVLERPCFAAARAREEAARQQH